MVRNRASVGGWLTLGALCRFFFRSYFAFNGVGRSSLEVPRVNFSLGWFCIWCGERRHSMQVIAGVFRVTNLPREREREIESSVVETLVKRKSKARYFGLP